MSQPLVTCIMPTGGRPALATQAVRYFLEQDYPHRELVVVDDGEEGVESLLPFDTRVRCLRLPTRHSIGAKRNIACEAALGDVIVHWDDDDWYAPGRLSYQLEALMQRGVDLCGLNRVLYLEPSSGRSWRYIYPRAPGLRPWLSGNSLCYRRKLWSRHRFQARDAGEDLDFLWRVRHDAWAVLPDERFLVGTIHHDNAALKRVDGSRWHPIPSHEVFCLLGEALPFYREPSHFAWGSPGKEAVDLMMTWDTGA